MPCTSLLKEDNKDDKSNHPASFSTMAATGFRLGSVNILFETSSTDLGNLLKAQHCLLIWHNKKGQSFCHYPNK